MITPWKWNIRIVVTASQPAIVFIHWYTYHFVCDLWVVYVSRYFKCRGQCWQICSYQIIPVTKIAWQRDRSDLTASSRDFQVWVTLIRL